MPAFSLADVEASFRNRLRGNPREATTRPNKDGA